MSFIYLGIGCIIVSLLVWVIASLVKQEWELVNILFTIPMSIMLFMLVWCGVNISAGIYYDNLKQKPLSEEHFVIENQNIYYLVSAGDDKYVYLSPGTYNFVYKDEDGIPKAINEKNVNHVEIHTDVAEEPARVLVREWHIKNPFIKDLISDSAVYVDYVLYLPNADVMTMCGY